MAKGSNAKKPNRLTRFFAETIGELRKVSWPTRDEALRLTAIVLVVLVISSAFLGTLDFLLTEFFKFLLA